VITKHSEITGHAGAIYSCTANNNFLFTVGADKIVAMWDLSSQKQLSFGIKLDASAYSIKILNDSILAIGLSNGNLHLVDFKEKKELKFFKQHKSAIFSIEPNLSRNHFYVGDADGFLSVWKLDTLTLEMILPLNCGKIRSISSSKNGGDIVLACQNEEVKVFETEFYNEIFSKKQHKEGVTAVIFHPNNNDVIISGGKDAYIKVFNWRSNVKITEFPAHNFAIYDLITAQADTVLVSASRDKSIKVWRLDNFEFLEKVERKQGGHSHSINDLEFINESEIVSVGDDKRIITWSLNELI